MLFAKMIPWLFDYSLKSNIDRKKALITLIGQMKRLIFIGALIMLQNFSFAQVQTDTIEEHLYKLSISKDKKAFIAYALKVQKDHPKFAREAQVGYDIIRSALTIDDTILADKHAAKFLKASSKDDFNNLYKSDVCLKMANFYHDKGNTTKEVYWLKLRLYKWTMEKCGVGKRQRNTKFYERIIVCYDKLGNTSQKIKFQKRLNKYKASKNDAWITP